MKENINRLECREEILSITKEMVGIKSEVNTDREKATAETIHDMLRSHAYFEANPSHLVMTPTINDERGRYNVMAFKPEEWKEHLTSETLPGVVQTVSMPN